MLAKLIIIIIIRKNLGAYDAINKVKNQIISQVLANI